MVTGGAKATVPCNEQEPAKLSTLSLAPAGVGPATARAAARAALSHRFGRILSLMVLLPFRLRSRHMPGIEQGEGLAQKAVVHGIGIDQSLLREPRAQADEGHGHVLRGALERWRAQVLEARGDRLAEGLAQFPAPRGVAG